MIVEIYIDEDNVLYELIEQLTFKPADIFKQLQMSEATLLLNNNPILKFQQITPVAGDYVKIICPSYPVRDVDRLRLAIDDGPTVYTIDPSGCSDADDAFSIWEEDDLIHLRIHVADPTSYMIPKGLLFNRVVAQAQTIYPFGLPPQHLFPNEILNRCTLMNGSHKRTIAVHACFDRDFKLTSATIEHCIVDCDSCNRYSYEQAAVAVNNVFKLGVYMSKQLRLARIRNMTWMKDGEADISLTMPGINGSAICLKPDTEEVKQMKVMIAEFAILANSVFAKDAKFLRSAVLTDEIKQSSNLTGQTLLHKIISQSVTATYTSESIPHEVVTGELYTHATSPLRRASDCIVHMIIKKQIFTAEELQAWSAHLTARAKEIKKQQFNEIKKATLEWMSMNLPVNISVCVMSNYNGFVNLIITMINGMPVNISYTLKRKQVSKLNLDLVITKVFLNLKYDEGTLPELDAAII